MSLILSKKIYDIKEIPKKTGIYFFLDINGIPIYIGKSLNLYKRVNQHINSKSTKSSKLKSRFDHIRYLETKSVCLGTSRHKSVSETQRLQAWTYSNYISYKVAKRGLETRF